MYNINMYNIKNKNIPSKAVRINILFPEELINSLKKIAGKRKRSNFIVEATKEKINKIKLGLAIESAAGCWKDEEYANLKTSEDIEKWIREIRTRDNKRLKGSKVG